MGYGLGIFLLAVGLHPRARRHRPVSPTSTSRWSAGSCPQRGALVVVLDALPPRRRAAGSTAVTQYSDGSRVVQERNDPPPAV